MKATYNDFLLQNTNCSGYSKNPDAIAIFDLLSIDSAIIKMIDASNAGKPALSACAVMVEQFNDSRKNSQVDLRNGFTRTVIGRMAKTILAPFGYLPIKQSNFQKHVGAKYFTSAMCYIKSGEATMEIAREVREIVPAYISHDQPAV